MKLHLPALLTLLLIFGALFTASAQTNIDIIPYPASIEKSGGSFTLHKALIYSAQMDVTDLKELKAYLPSYPLELIEGDEASLRLIIDAHADVAPEGYRLTVGKKEIEIKASTSAGLFYGLQTLAQLAAGKQKIACLTIEDAPRFGYRGMHLDVSRHFFGVAFIKKQLDAMASYKLNRFHWHLTDGPGWRLDIPQYPELARRAAWRPQALWKEWWNSGRQYCTRDDEGAYGGYYTAADVKEVVEYARLRHITVIPEIEMPGHSEEVCAVYPELSCSGEPYKNADVCIGNEKTFKFFEDVLDVVMELFPSKYIHIGGDEAGKESWKSCPKCQERMRQEHLDNVDGLQSYMIARIEKYLNDHGRSIIGWDEILQGGLAPNATVMSWRGTEGGIAAAHAGHDAIMTPGEYCYFDHYQGAPATQPEAIGGYLPIEQVYSYNPVPAEWPDSVARHILGVQANLWAEYIPNDKQMEYMIYPRLTALAEVGWTPVSKKNWESFKVRANQEIKRLEAKGYNPYPLADYPMVRQSVNRKAQCIEVTLLSERTPVDIRYTLDGSEPTAHSKRYKKAIAVSDTATLKAALYCGKQRQGGVTTVQVNYHKGIGAKAVYARDGGYYTYDERYKAGGDSALVDGQRGGSTYTDGRWQGFCPRDMDVTLDLGRITTVHRVIANFMQDVGPWIFFPSRVEVSLSTDGIHFTPAGEQRCDVPIDASGCLFKDFGWQGAPRQARYIRYHATQSEKKAFIFTDEIVIN